MGSYGFIWVHMGLLGSYGFIGFIWVHLGSYGFIWSHMGSYGAVTNLLSFNLYEFISVCMIIYICRVMIYHNLEGLVGHKSDLIALLFYLR